MDKFDKNKRYTFSEIVKISGQKQSTLYRRKDNRIKNKKFDSVDGKMRFNLDEIIILLKFQNTDPRSKS